MSFMAVAYVPAFLEDRANFAKERANGLYGATPFLISNSSSDYHFSVSDTIPKPHKADRSCSSYLNPVLDCLVLALQLSSQRRGLLHLGDVGFPRPRGGRVTSCAGNSDIPQFCDCACARGIC